LRSRPGRCCSEGCALQGLRFLARSGPWVAKPAGCRLAFLRSRHLQGTVVHQQRIKSGRPDEGSLGWRHGQVAEGLGRELGRQPSYRPTRLTPDNEEKGRLGGGPTEGKRDTGGGLDNSRSGVQCPQTSLAVLSDGKSVLRQKFTRGRLRRRSGWNRHGEIGASRAARPLLHPIAFAVPNSPTFRMIFLEVSPFSVPNVVTKQTKSERLSDKCARLCDYLK